MSAVLRHSARRAALTGAVLVAAGLTVGACGGSTSPRILNTEKVERAIEQSSLTQRKKVVHVSCPSGVHQKKGLAFYCVTLKARGAVTRFLVTELDGAGHVHYAAVG